MFHILDNRGTGKTGRLFLLAKEQNATIICHNPAALRDKAYRYGITGINFISYENWIEIIENPDFEWRVDFPKNILIDDLTMFLRFMSKMTETNVIGYNLSIDD